MTTRPLIGITGHQLTGSAMPVPPAFADAPFDGYFREYADAVARAGGIPVYLPHGVDSSQVLGRIDGLLLSGGEDVDPRRYGSVPDEKTTPVSPARDQHELELCRDAFARGLPVLGICRGIQLLNVALGGTLVSDLPLGTGESHSSPVYPRAHRTHTVSLEPGTLAHRLLGDTVAVNSFHHQAVDEVGDGLVVSGRAPDGVVEAIEHPGRPLLGVQWHPECFPDTEPVFTWLVETSANHPAAAPGPTPVLEERA